MRNVLATTLTASFGIILTGCALLMGSPAPKYDPLPLLCDTFPPVHWSPGDDKKAVEILERVKSSSLPITPEALKILREALGDTDGTIAQIKPNNAVWTELCGGRAPAPGKLNASAG